MSTKSADHFSHATFIPAIEGLRALAVLAVLLFHLDLPGVAGGYLGVDLFFVISGFIITRNILMDSNSGRFTLREFYVRRFRRLFPALLVTVLATLALAPLVMPPLETKQAAISALYAIFSLANFNFWLEAGYFDAAAHTKPLLHTWSLSVEEQFYLFWPALLVLVAANRPRLIMIIVLLLASVVATLMFLDRIPDAIFYLVPFRVHQLMAGALLAVLALRLSGLYGSLCVVFGSAGFIALVSLFGEDGSPALGAVAVTFVGAALLLGRESRLALALYGSRPLQWVGQRSYAIYLVHWPVVVLYKYATNFHLVHWEMLALFAVSIVGAAFLHELVEKPFRKRGEDVTRMQRLALPFSLAGLAGAVALAAVTISQEGFKRQGDWFVQHMVASVPHEMMVREDAIRYGTCNLHKEHSFQLYSREECAVPEPGKANVFVLGDSMGADIYMMLSLAYPEINFLQATAGACAPLVAGSGFAAHYPACKALNDERFLLALDDEVDLVIIAGIWKERRIESLVKTVQYLKKHGKKVLVFGPRSSFRGGVPTLLAGETSLEGVNERLQEHLVRHDKVMAAMRGALPEVELVDMHTIQCAPQCIAVEGGQLLYIDAIHFTRRGAEFMGERFRQIYDLPALIARGES